MRFRLLLAICFSLVASYAHAGPLIFDEDGTFLDYEVAPEYYIVQGVGQNGETLLGWIMNAHSTAFDLTFLFEDPLESGWDINEGLNYGQVGTMAATQQVLCSCLSFNFVLGTQTYSTSNQGVWSAEWGVSVPEGIPNDPPAEAIIRGAGDRSLLFIWNTDPIHRGTFAIYDDNGGRTNVARIDSITRVPEPASVLLLGIGLAGVFGARRSLAA